ncbi:MAG: hypothetical protein LBT59_21880 [Clostridiales bacterium]|nr:hypothetical protein [Clostridiales bacterium]
MKVMCPKCRNKSSKSDLNGKAYDNCPFCGKSFLAEAKGICSLQEFVDYYGLEAISGIFFRIWFLNSPLMIQMNASR